MAGGAEVGNTGQYEMGRAPAWSATLVPRWPGCISGQAQLGIKGHQTRAPNPSSQNPAASQIM